MFSSAPSGGSPNARSNIWPDSKFLNIPCRQSSGASLPYRTHDGEGVMTFANEWSDYRANPAGTNGVIVNDQRFDEIFNLSTLSGGLMILLSMTYSAAPSATEKIFQYGASSRAIPGGIYIDVSASNLRCVVTPSDTSVASSFVQRPPATALNDVLTMCVYIDMSRDLLIMGINNEWTNSNASLGIADIKSADKLIGTTDGNYGFSLFGQHNASATTLSTILNSGTGNVSISDFWAVRFESDQLTNVPGMFLEYTKSPRSNMARLKGK